MSKYVLNLAVAKVRDLFGSDGEVRWALSRYSFSKSACLNSKLHLFKGGVIK